MNRFDILVLTAANEAQAEGYRAQLREREMRGALPHVKEWRVVADAGGRRVGSGAATLAVLRELAHEVFAAKGKTVESAHIAECFAGRRVLLVHSGGDARRIPAYAALGKVFLPLPCDITPPGAPAWKRHPAALLDLLLQTFAELPASDEGEVLLCSGDVLLTFDAPRTRLDAAGGVMGLGFAAPPDIGTRHGVYLCDSPSVGGAVAGFLQKPTLAQMRRANAFDSSGRILVDTGVMSLAPRAVAALLQAAPSISTVLADGATLDWYREIACALVPGTSCAAYLASLDSHSPTSLKELELFFNRLQNADLPFQVCAVPDGEFFHVGTTRDLSQKLSAPSRTAQKFGFRNESPRPDCLIFNSRGAVPSNALYIENCDFATSDLATSDFATSDFAGAQWLIGVDEDARRLFDEPLRLPPACGLAFWPVRRGSRGAAELVPLVFGADDDFKTPCGDDSRFLGAPLGRLREAGFSDADLWPENEIDRTLWTARLWSVGARRGAALVQLLAVMRGEKSDTLRALWREPRRSWAELLREVDHAELLKRRRRLEAWQQLQRLPADVLRFDDFPVEEARHLLRETNSDPSMLAAWLNEQLQTQSEPLVRARLAHGIGEVLALAPKTARIAVGTEYGRIRPYTGSSVKARDFGKMAFDEIARAVQSNIVPNEARPAAILPDQAVWATAPARIDLAGGWSDTPPICLERGGTVLNAAVRLNGQFPIQVVAKLNQENRIRLTSIDLGRQEVLKNNSAFDEIPNFAHWSALAKTALALSGIVPDAWRDGRASLGEHLEILGGGLDISIFSGLPKGSGLGSSSILGAALLACLARVRGEECTHAELFARTSALEQRLGSGGGWQDQIGGIAPGVKLIRTQPGLVQTPSLQWTPFGGGASGAPLLRARLLLLFTGQTRRAQHILARVVERYLAREPEVLRIIDRLKHGAENAAQALAAGDIAQMAASLNEYWELKKALDPGSTNAEIEILLARLAPFTAAACACGAGGGGFLAILARDANAATEIRHIVKREPPHPNARFFDWEIDETGLAVSVL